jgi:hypothetical protein
MKTIDPAEKEIKKLTIPVNIMLIKTHIRGFYYEQ